ncbi:MAG: PEP-CTERM sorting domain-containing protein [Cyanobacteriota bacterium]
MGEVLRLLQAALQPSPGQVQHQLGPARGEQLRVGNVTSAIIQAIPAAPIPEPGAFAKMLLALGVLGGAAKRRKSLHAWHAGGSHVKGLIMRTLPILAPACRSSL